MPNGLYYDIRKMMLVQQTTVTASYHSLQFHKSPYIKKIRATPVIILFLGLSGQQRC